LTQASFLKTRKHFRKHYIEKDSPRIARRKNRQLFPRKDLIPLERNFELIPSGDPVPLSEMILEIMETLSREFEASSHVEQSRKTGTQNARGRR